MLFLEALAFAANTTKLGHFSSETPTTHIHAEYSAQLRCQSLPLALPREKPGNVPRAGRVLASFAWLSSTVAITRVAGHALLYIYIYIFVHRRSALAAKKIPPDICRGWFCNYNTEHHCKRKDIARGIILRRVSSFKAIGCCRSINYPSSYLSNKLTECIWYCCCCVLVTSPRDKWRNCN